MRSSSPTKMAIRILSTAGAVAFTTLPVAAQTPADTTDRQACVTIHRPEGPERLCLPQGTDTTIRQSAADRDTTDAEPVLEPVVMRPTPEARSPMATAEDLRHIAERIEGRRSEELERLDARIQAFLRRLEAREDSVRRTRERERSERLEARARTEERAAEVVDDSTTAVSRSTRDMAASEGEAPSPPGPAPERDIEPLRVTPRPGSFPLAEDGLALEGVASRMGHLSRIVRELAGQTQAETVTAATQQELVDVIAEVIEDLESLRRQVAAGEGR